MELIPLSLVHSRRRDAHPDENFFRRPSSRKYFTRSRNSQWDTGGRSKKSLRRDTCRTWQTATNAYPLRFLLQLSVFPRSCIIHKDRWLLTRKGISHWDYIIQINATSLRIPFEKKTLFSRVSTYKLQIYKNRKKDSKIVSFLIFKNANG